jgi:hypothetical protein
MRQVFMVYGWLRDFPHYVYPFTDPDEAMEFVDLVSAYDSDYRWEIITETVRPAQQTYDLHRAWVEE